MLKSSIYVYVFESNRKASRERLGSIQKDH